MFNKKKTIIFSLSLLLIIFLVSIILFEIYLWQNPNVSLSDFFNKNNGSTSLPQSASKHKYIGSVVKSESNSLTISYTTETGKTEEKELLFSQNNFAWIPRNDDIEPINSFDDLVSKKNVEFEFPEENTVYVYYE